MRKVLVGMPAHANVTPRAAAGLFRCTADPDLALTKVHTNSLLAHCTNLLWVAGLNGRRRGEFTHFALQHADVEPEPFWLDLMLAEMDAGGFDVLGGVVPLKDGRGLTSTAVGRDDGDTWRVAKRLSLAEVHALPETFTSADVGGPLLLNTGLLLVKLGDWSERCWFTIRDELAEDVDGDLVALVEPEDWGFSRQLHRLGLRVGCTRRVRLAHCGPAPFPNTHAWGSMRTDLDNERANQAEVSP